MIDTVLRSATIYDGTGRPGVVGDLAIDVGRIASVGVPVEGGTARESIDLTGLAIAPGFIDLHTHSDVSLLSDAGCISAIEQGVTTQAVGLCGFSAGPLSTESLRLTLLRYQAGEVSVIEVKDAQTTLIQARAAADDGLVRYRIALANLQTLTGAF